MAKVTYFKYVEHMRVPSKAQVWDFTVKAARRAGRSTVQLARVGFAFGLLVLAERVVAGEVSTDDALAVAGLSLAAVTALALSPRAARDLAERISKISVGPVALEVVKVAEDTPSSTSSLDDS